MRKWKREHDLIKRQLDRLALATSVIYKKGLLDHLGRQDLYVQVSWHLGNYPAQIQSVSVTTKEGYNNIRIYRENIGYSGSNPIFLTDEEILDIQKFINKTNEVLKNE